MCHSEKGNFEMWRKLGGGNLEKSYKNLNEITLLTEQKLKTKLMNRRVDD